MTLPSDFIFTLNPQKALSGEPDNIVETQKWTITQIQNMYRHLADTINGSIGSWTPTIIGSTSAGTATYTVQQGVYLRQGLLVDTWFDVQWSGHTGTGNMRLTGNPFTAASNPQRPWVGSLELGDSVTLSTGYTYAIAKVQPGNRYITLVECGSNVVAKEIPMDSAGRFMGHVRYIGLENA